MKWIEARVMYDAKTGHLISDLISDIFYDLDLQGVLLEDPEFEKADNWNETDWVDETLKMPARLAVVGYFAKDDLVDEKCRILGDRVGRLAVREEISTDLVFRELDDQDWAETWKAYFWPQRITQKITVKPTWRGYEPEPGERVIAIDPGMAFGTGTHPTSHLCIQMIEAYLKPGDGILDVGTGSGLLLIAAALLGARRGVGVDIDDDAVEIARENLTLNRVDGTLFGAQAGSFVEGIADQFDFVTANLLPNAVSTLLDSVKDVLTPGGVFVCSGILEEHQDAIVGKMATQGFEIFDIRVKETWVAIAGRSQI